MAISEGHRFPIEFDEAFPQGLVMVGEISPDNEYQSREDMASGRPTWQRVDESTGERQWKLTVTDPDELKAKRASFELDRLTAEPKVAGQGEFKFQSYAFRATGFKAAASAGGTKTARSSAGGDTAKAACR